MESWKAIDKMCGLRITFLLPGAGRVPCGGFKIVYEYANRLSRLGHTIAVVHAALSLKGTPLRDRPRRSLSYIGHRLLGTYSPASWFPIDPGVRLIWAPSLHQRYIPDADVLVASAWQTAEWAEQYELSKGRKFYLIQDLEDWECSTERLYATWKSSLKKIVIAGWLKDIADDLGEESTYIPNGLDFERFDIDAPIERRDPHRMMMLYHLRPSKGVADGMEALNIVKKHMPGLRVTLFGTPHKPLHLPDWIRYHQSPSQTELRQLYNEASVFIAPSWSEGWGLTPCEAMLAGAAVVATVNGGHKEFALHEQTALVSPPKNPDKLAANILRLIQDPELRVKLAQDGNRYVHRFSWDRSVKALEELLARS